jgi:Sec-independent protein translocase protein TatA
MFGISFTEFAVILIAALLLGPRELVRTSSFLGSKIRELKAFAGNLSSELKRCEGEFRSAQSELLNEASSDLKTGFAGVPGFKDGASKTPGPEGRS